MRLLVGEESRQASVAVMRTGGGRGSVSPPVCTPKNHIKSSLGDEDTFVNLFFFLPVSVNRVASHATFCLCTLYYRMFH